VLPLAPASRQKLLALEFDASLVRWWHAAKGGAGAGSLAGGVSSSSSDGVTGLLSGGGGAAARVRTSRKRAAPSRSTAAASSASKRATIERDAATGRASRAQTVERRGVVVRRTFEGSDVRTLDVGAGGNCYFRALAHQLDGGLDTSSEAAYATKRLEVATYAAVHAGAMAAHFADVLVAQPELQGEGGQWQQVIDLLQREGVWNNPLLDAVLAPLAASCFGRVVRIWQRETPVQVFEPVDNAAAAELAAPPLDLFRCGDHIVSVLRQV
jgi:hypothetical protein